MRVETDLDITLAPAKNFWGMCVYTQYGHWGDLILIA